MSEDDNISYPTLHFESFVLSFIIDRLEGRDVTIFDIPGAYLHAEMFEDKFFLIKFRGQFAEIMSEVGNNHKNNITIKKWKESLVCEGSQSHL